MFDENIKFKYSWRPYQAKVLQEVDKYIKDKKVNIVAAPGSGKTVLGLELARKLAKPVLILSPTVTIKNQWIDRFVSLFMPEGTIRPDWISDNVYKLSYFNSITYQGLHYAYKRKTQKITSNKQETDDEIVEEVLETDVEVKTYDLVDKIKENNISTIILDEAHHLKSQWWQSLTNVIEKLTDVNIISLTATPPYDIEYSEWQKYSKLCGNIDIEISVPELVQAKNLCPHQDYVYLSYPTVKEKELIKKYETEVKEFINYLKTNEEFIQMLKNHPYIKYTNSKIEKILEKPEFYSSMLIFLNDSNVPIDKEKVKILGHNKPIPKLTTYWMEVLLQNILFENLEYFTNYLQIIEDVKTKLNKLGAIEKKNIYLSKNSTLQKYFVNSISKLDSINKIVKAEWDNLNEKLRMVILTDFIRKEYLSSDNLKIKKIGVFPIFLNLLNSYPNINIAVLTGSIYVIPNSKKQKLLEHTINKGINSKNIEFIQLEKLPNYSIVKTTEQNKNTLMKCISTLFSDGDVNIIIGTKSLLGEGWDEPSINSLVLASFVGSYVLSNQMRGRAIRTNDNPYKTANVWHLVCATDVDKNTIENPDLEMLKRRFNAFVGIGYNKEILESGIERLDTIPSKFSEKNIDKYNEEVVKISNGRDRMYHRWFEIVEKFGGSKIKVYNQIEAKKENLKNKFGLLNAMDILKVVLTAIVATALTAALQDTNLYKIMLKDFKLGVNIFLLQFGVFFAILLLLNIRMIIKCIKAIRFSIPKGQLETMAMVVINSLCDTQIIDCKRYDVKINCIENKEEGKIELSIDGVTTHENNIIISSLKDIFATTETQRYIIVNRKNYCTAYYNVPNVLSTKKELAQEFYNNWLKYIGDSKLVYTKNLEGRKILLEARKNTFDYYIIDKFIEKKRPVSNWE